MEKTASAVLFFSGKEEYAQEKMEESGSSCSVFFLFDRSGFFGLCDIRTFRRECNTRSSAV